MPYKIYTKGNYFYIIDNDTNREYNSLSKDVIVTRSTPTSDDFYFRLIKNWESDRLVNIADIEKENGDAYTLDLFVDFYENATRQSAINQNFNYEVALGNIEGASTINKFGFNNDIDDLSGEEIIASFGGDFNPITQVITTAQTFTITYDQTADGLGQTGALSLIITYLDENYLDVSAFHTLSNTGSDVTSFTGLGINRVVVFSNGGIGWNDKDITLTATIDGTTQAQIPAGKSATQQGLFHTQIGFSFLMDFIKISALKLSGGGGSPKVSIRGYSYSRVTLTRYEVINLELDTDVENTIIINENNPFVFGGREVIYFTAETDKDNTKVTIRFSGVTTNQ